MMLILFLRLPQLQLILEIEMKMRKGGSREGKRYLRGVRVK